MDGQDLGSRRKKIPFYKVKNTKKHFSRVYRIQGYAFFTFKKVDKINQLPVHFGVTSKMIIGYESPTLILSKSTNLLD